MNGLVVFDLVGFMAHFRKFYTNASSLSYVIPPRTTLAGLIAGILGRDRDSYYEEFSLRRARIGVALGSRVRTVMQTVHYLATDDLDWCGLKRRIQVPLELVLPHPSEKVLRYRVYFSHEDEKVNEEVFTRLEKGAYAYPPFLGLTACAGWVENVAYFEAGKVEAAKDLKEPVEISTALVASRLLGWPSLEVLAGKRFMKDRMPLDFDQRRRPRVVDEVVWEAEGQVLPLLVKGEVFRPPGERAWATFLEP